MWGLRFSSDKLGRSPKYSLYCITEPPGHFFESVGSLGLAWLAARQRLASWYVPSAFGTKDRCEGVRAS